MTKKRIRYSKKLATFVCDKVAAGMNVEEICREFSDKLPVARTLHKWQKQHPEFLHMMTDAYNSFMFVKMAELDELTKTPLSKLYPDLPDDRLRMEARRARMDALKFLLNSVAPALNQRWNKSQKVEIEGKLDAPQIVIQSYALPKDITPNKLEDKTIDG